MKDAEADSGGKRRRRSARIAAWTTALAIGILCLPTVVAWTPLRNTAVNLLLTDLPWRATVKEASFGWFSPLSLRGLELERTRGEASVDVARVQADRSWLQMLWGRSDLGRFTIDRPRFEGVLGGEPAEAPPPAPRPFSQGGPSLDVVVNAGSFSLRAQAAKDPVIDIRNVDLELQIERDATGRALVIPPARILDHQPLTADLCDRGLHLIAPVLASAVRVEGQVTLELDGLRTPLDRDSLREALDGTQAHGRLIAHQVATGLKNPVLQSVAELTAGLLDTSMPQAVRLVDEREIEFHIEDGRVFHEGLEFGLPELDPDLVFRTRGSVGIDETLDLTIEAPLPADVLGDGPLARALSQRPLVLAVTGSLSQPKLQLAQNGGAIEQLIRAIVEEGDESDQPLAATILDLIGGLTDSANGLSAEGAPLRDLLQQWRERRERRREEEAHQPPGPEGAEGSPRAEPSRPLLRLFQRLQPKRDSHPLQTPP